MKPKYQLYAINAFLTVGMILLGSYYFYMDSEFSTKKPIDDEKRLSLELRLPLIPGDSAVHSYYKQFIEDDILSKAEYVTLVQLEQKYFDALGAGGQDKVKSSLAQMTALEREKENLASFERFGSKALPPELVQPAREAILEKIEKLETEEAEAKKPN